MKGIPVMFLAASLILAPYTAAANAKGSPAGPPPIEQPLVREGEFAAELANSLNLTTSKDEAAAESYLVSVGIMPRNGWIADYPMTPDIIAEIRQSAAGSASSGNLHISGTDAAVIVDKVVIAMNLPVRGAGSEYRSSSGASSPDVSEYVGPSDVKDYYYDNEPPIVTYYAPPWEYAYLYDWVPCPFWWGGFEFGGYFVLGDFDRRDHHHRITNHITNANGTAGRIDATARAGAATANRQTGSRAAKTDNTASTANTSTSRNRLSSGFTRDSDRAMRDPGSATRDMDRFSSSHRATPDVSSISPFYSGRPFSSDPSPHFSTGGGMGGGFRGGGGMGGFHGGGRHR